MILLSPDQKNNESGIFCVLYFDDAHTHFLRKVVIDTQKSYSPNFDSVLSAVTSLNSLFVCSDISRKVMANGNITEV